MTRPEPPAEVVAAAEARAAARERRDWPEADRLRAGIEAEGWSVIDDGDRFRLRPTHPPDLEVGGLVRHGWSGSVARRDPGDIQAGVTVAIVASGEPGTTAAAFERARAIRAGLAHRGDASSIIVLDGLGRADAPVRASGSEWVELVATASPIGPAGCLDIVVRRAAHDRVVVLRDPGPSHPATIERLIVALDVPDVAIAGIDGLSLRRLPRLESAAPTAADAVDLSAAAFRLGDAAAVGEPDLRLRTWVGAGAWLSRALLTVAASERRRRIVVIEAAEDRDSFSPFADPAMMAAVRRDGYRLLPDRA